VQVQQVELTAGHLINIVFQLGQRHEGLARRDQQTAPGKLRPIVDAAGRDGEFASFRCHEVEQGLGGVEEPAIRPRLKANLPGIDDDVVGLILARIFWNAREGIHQLETNCGLPGFSRLGDSQP
jgi:hypothetical protein